MQSLDTSKKYIKDLFLQSCFYNIPEYQRPYVWESEQVEALLEDISAAQESESKKEYFLGCMIWNTKTVDAEVEYTLHDILDGQQRFLTLYLLLAAIRNLSSDPKIKTNVQNALLQEEDEYRNLPQRIRITFEVNEDFDFIQTFIVAQAHTLDETALLAEQKNPDNSRTTRNMANALLTIQRWWKKKTQSLDEAARQQKIAGFFRYLFNHVLVLYLATPNNLDDAYNLFTILNSRGLQLQPSDILKAQNLRLIKDDRLRKQWAEDWSEFEDEFGGIFPDFDAFLWALVDIQMKYRSDQNKSLALAFDFMDKNKLVARGTAFFALVKKYIEHYRYICDSLHQHPDTHFKNLLRLLASTSPNRYAIPLMHYRECFGEYRLTEFLLKLDNLLSMMWLLGKRDNDTRIHILLRKMEETLKSAPNRQQAAEMLLNSRELEYTYAHENAHTALDVAEFERLIREEKWGAFAGSKINKTKYLLLKLDILYGNKNIHYGSPLPSLEHLMPQSRSYWPEIPAEEHALWCHRLGNLILLDSRKNSSISNQPFATKKTKYYRPPVESGSHTNYLFGSHDHWDIATIQANHERVCEKLLDYYRGNSLEAFQKLLKQP